MTPELRRWWTQIVAIVRLELKKNFAFRRALPLYLLAALPLAIFVVHALAYARGWSTCHGTEDLTVFAGVFQLFVLRLVVFFGCVTIFLNLFRGEIVHKSLHYYFLAPVRREVLAVGKYLSGLLTACCIFGTSVALSYFILCRHLAATPSAALAAPALNQLATYTGVTLLACAGYGAVFLLLGMLYRNPIVPAIAVLVWESLIVFFPPLLKKISIIFYLESLCPVRVPFDGPGRLFAIAANPTPPYLAVPGLVLLAVAIVAAAALRIRRMEVSYGAE
jgi:ABC-type transport system involved in multi-copper enzyme maturation permease subunit